MNILPEQAEALLDPRPYKFVDTYNIKASMRQYWGGPVVLPLAASMEFIPADEEWALPGHLLTGHTESAEEQARAQKRMDLLREIGPGRRMKPGWCAALARACAPASKRENHMMFLFRQATLATVRDIGEYVGDMSDYRRLYFSMKLKRKMKR